MPQLFAQLITQLPNRAIVATLPSPGRIAAKVNSVIDAARVSRDLRVVETSVLGAGSWRGRLATNHFHPNDHGYAAIAQTLNRLLSMRPLNDVRHLQHITHGSSRQREPVPALFGWLQRSLRSTAIS